MINMLLLLLPLNLIQKKYVDFYFYKLNDKYEKDFFLRNFNDTFLVDFLSKLTSLFIKHPFDADEIVNFAKEMEHKHIFVNNNLKPINITKYQKQFYRDVYREHQQTGECGYYDEIQHNEAFWFFMMEEESAYELFFMDIHYNLNKNKMTEEEKKEFMLKRLMKAAFPDKEKK